MNYYIVMAAIGGALIVAGYNKLGSIGSYSDYLRSMKQTGFPGDDFESSYQEHVDTEKAHGRFFIGLGLFLIGACAYRFL